MHASHDVITAHILGWTCSRRYEYEAHKERVHVKAYR